MDDLLDPSAPACSGAFLFPPVGQTIDRLSIVLGRPWSDLAPRRIVLLDAVVNLSLY